MTDFIGFTALTLLYTMAVIGWGGLVFRLTRQPDDSIVTGAAGRFILGLATLYVLFLALSLAGRLHRIEVGVVIGLGALACGVSIPAVFDRAALSAGALKTWRRMDLAIAGGVAFLVVTQWIFALTPLMFYDLLTYHFLAPAQFLSAGSLVHIPWNVQSNSPLALQLTTGMSLALDSSGQIAKFLMTVIGTLAPAGAYALLRDSSRRAGLLAALCILCFPEFWVMQTLGVVDLPVAALTLWGAVWARRAMQEGNWREALLSGAALGLAVGSRYQVILLTSWLLAVIFVETRRAQPRLLNRKTAGAIALIGCLIIVMLAPWLIRNYAHMGNPVFPIAMEWLGGAEWSATQNAALQREALGAPLTASTPLQAVLAPFAGLMVLPSNGLFGLGLLLAALIAVAGPQRSIRLAAILGLGGLVLWGLLRPAAGVPLLRYNALSFVFLLAATGAVLGSEWLPEKTGTRIALALCGGSWIIAMLHVHSIIPAVQSIVNPVARKAVQDRFIPSSAAFGYINEKLDPERDKVLVLGETRGFWLRVPFIAPSAFNGPQLESLFSKDPVASGWSNELANLKITHILLSNSEMERLHKNYGYMSLPADQADALSRWMQSLAKVFDDGRGNVVLALNGARESD
jgi:hypothetical protein